MLIIWKLFKNARWLVLWLVCGCVLPAQAYVLDWDAVAWPTNQQWSDQPGAVSATFSNVQGSGINVTVSVTQAPATTDANTANPTTTPNDSGLELNSTDNALQVDLDADNGAYVDQTFNNGGTEDYLVFTITFSETVDFVSYTLQDIDFGNTFISRYQDSVVFDPANQPTSLTLLGSNGDGTGTFDAEIYTLGSGDSAIRGIATNGATNLTGNQNDGSTSGHVQVDYAGSFTSGTSFSFEYGSLDGSSVLGSPFGSGLFVTPPSLQRIALSDITFTVPEPSTYVTGALLLGLAGWGVFRQWCRRRDASQRTSSRTPAA